MPILYRKSLSCFGLPSKNENTRLSAHCSLDNFIDMGASTFFSNVPFIRTDSGLVLYAPMPRLYTTCNVLIGTPAILLNSFNEYDRSVDNPFFFKKFSRRVIVDRRRNVKNGNFI